MGARDAIAKVLLDRIFYKAMEGNVPRMEGTTGLTHVAADRKIAEQFSGGGKRPVREVQVLATNPFDYRNPDHLNWLMKEMDNPKNVEAYNRDTKNIMGPDYTHEADADYIRAGLQEGAYQTYEVPAISNLIRSKGYDAIHMIEDFQKGEPNLALFDPAHIKILRSAMPGAVGTAGVMSAIADQGQYQPPDPMQGTYQ